ncbi:polar amino acid transport system ATP-binding protein/putative glutamine transport system ATP-binding protein [Brevibacterium sanguinis]|uniref:Polar amino acid transport system ATP-binding protein/putative glutamine transport system ATP-binding protein n=2 Tax=Brevibacterium TaxID=1696 RepID=A0A366IMS3_9MICO|nr:MULTISPECIES: ATP-binding cassette domain-containing protein [Brevibacterium]RBP65722.1 polar amino acid transport system ATP-binding protein/putative glutamine transport system ATP-binding protein [Brevibacterium sanguinis]RBP72356.1 polar amino acid transport system ATP-binding protein/putative glutamine transport system ATP-binding protein [Brevibacterium celere]
MSENTTARAGAGRTISAKQGDILVSCRGLQKSFGDREVMKSIDFDMRAGDITVIIGRSGSGKSTLLRAIAGLTDPDDGEMVFDGEVVFTEGKRTPAWSQVDSHVGMIFQSYTLWPHMDVLKNLTLAPRKKLGMSESESLERAERALAEVGMSPHLHSRPAQLSGGERQRVAIARALMMQPKLLLCDEITSALDPPVAAEVLDVLRRLKEEEGIAVALVTHDMAFASKAADRVVFFHEGEIAVNSTPDDAFNNTQDQDLKKFIDAVRF